MSTKDKVIDNEIGEDSRELDFQNNDHDMANIIHNQPTINVGMLGHVSHGKSQTVKTISSKKTQQFSSELERDITIKLGYANAKIWRCNVCKTYTSSDSSIKQLFCEKCLDNSNEMTLRKHVSFVDCFSPETKVMMHNKSIKTVQQLELGDQLMGPDGTPRNIKSFCSGEKGMYKIFFGKNNTEYFECTGGHILVLRLSSCVSKPFQPQRGNQQWIVCQYYMENDTLHAKRNKFDQKQDAQSFYEKELFESQITENPIDFEITVLGYLNSPRYIKKKARLFTSYKKVQDQMENGARRFSTKNTESFVVASMGLGEYRGFETDGDGRFLLHNYIVAHNCPGHEVYMTTMLNGTAIMDGALILISAASEIPQPQTSEHLLAADIMGLDKCIVLLNKLDLVTYENVQKQYKTTVDFLQNSIAENAPILPVSAQYGTNFDMVCEYIDRNIPQPQCDLECPPILVIIRSFDVNKCGCKYQTLKGGVAGGSLRQGTLKVGQTVEIRPGIVYKENGYIEYEPICAEITSLFSEKNSLDFAVPGGLIGIGTTLDPFMTRRDRLVGQVVGSPNEMPNVYDHLQLSYKLVKVLLGSCNKEAVNKLEKDEEIRLNVQSCNIQAKILSVTKSTVKVKLLNIPVCVTIGTKASICRNCNGRWRLIGFGVVQKGVVAKERK